MTEKANNPPAFPVTLRDYFAIHASESEIKEYMKTYAFGYNYSRARYCYADAMLAEREKYDRKS